MLDLKETLYEMAALGALKPVDPDAVTFANSFLFDAINIGEEMLVCGAEINVVEKTIHDICRAYGAKRVDVYATAYQITVTIYEASFGCLTQTRRIPETTLNFTKLEEFDRLARRVVDKTPTTIAIELGETPFFTSHFYSLFALGLVLFLLALGTNLLAEALIRREKRNFML